MQKVLHQRNKEIEDLQKQLAEKETTNDHQMTQQVPVALKEEVNQLYSALNSTNYVSENIGKQCGSFDHPITCEDKTEQVKSDLCVYTCRHTQGI